MTLLTATRRSLSSGMRKVPRAVVVQPNDMSAFVSNSSPSTTSSRKKKKGKHASTATSQTTSTIPSSLLRNMPMQTPDRESRTPMPTLAPVPFPGNVTAPRNEILSNAYVSPTSQTSTEVKAKSPMPPAALYGIIAAGGACLVLAFIFACVFLKRRKRQDRQTADWYGVQEKHPSGDQNGGPDSGIITKEIQMSDNGSYIEDEKDYDIDANSRAPVHILSKFPKLVKQGPNNSHQEKPMEISKPFGMNFHVTNPDRVPTRPPRPSAHIDLSTSPTRTSLKADNNQEDEEEPYDSDEEDAYERNILALTTSMAFDTPRDRQSRVFDPAMPMPDSADLGSSMREGRDTIVGFAESYGSLASPLLAQTVPEEPAPVRPLHIRNPSTATSRSKRPHFNRDVGTDVSQTDRNKVSEIPPTLSNVDLGLAASETTSMRELEDVLGSFGRSGTPLEKENPMETKQMTSGGTTFTLENNKSPYGASKIPAYKLNKPTGVERGLSVVRNTLSIQSTVGEVFEAGPKYSTFPTSATSPNLSNISHNDSNETLVESASALSSKRVSFAIDKEGYEGRSLADTGRVQSLAELVRSKSLKRFNSNSDLSKGDLRGAFEQMDSTTIPESTEPYRPAGGLQGFGARVRSSSFHGLSPALHAGWRADRQRTSTAYGGQMPPTPLLATPLLKDKRKTTDSEARFALGSHMLSVLDSPGGPEQVSPNLPYLRSPDLRIQPPSPSQASEMTTFSAMERERDYQDRLGQQGFTPLSQMALSSGNSGHSQYYRSPIDSIVGVFEFDDPHHSAVINSISLR